MSLNATRMHVFITGATTLYPRAGASHGGGGTLYNTTTTQGSSMLAPQVALGKSRVRLISVTCAKKSANGTDVLAIKDHAGNTYFSFSETVDSNRFSGIPRHLGDNGPTLSAGLSFLGTANTDWLALIEVVT